MHEEPMADFCKQCSMELFGEDFRDLAGITTEDQTKQSLYAQVLCEGCGPVIVDHDGKCVGSNCSKKHLSEKAPPC